MNDSTDWAKRYKDWKNEVGFQGEPSGLDVYKKLMENRARDNADFVDKMKNHFEQIDEILKETPSERANK